mmetsp:Transcript_80414/g.127006  ORF Transcript_80414/g.127006 Transcript_80414/m.127006 type:complete len:381 (-) Transcript_80414:46-1188(-)
MAVHLVVILGRREGSGHGPGALVLQQQGALGHPEVAHLAPVLAPGVAHDPVHAVLGISAPADHRDHVVHALALGLDDARLVVQQGIGINAAADGSAVEDLLHHGVGTRNGAVVCDGGVGVVAQAGAWATLLGEAAAGASHVFRLAGGVHMRAEALRGIGRAGDIGILGLIADSCALLGEFLQPLVRAIHSAALAAANTSAVQQVLHRQVDVHAVALARDLDAIAQCRDGAVGPAAAAVLRNVLVARHRAVVPAALVAPGEIRWHLHGLQELVGALLGRIAAPGHTQLLGLLARQQLGAMDPRRSAGEDRGGELGGILLGVTRAGHRRSLAPGALGVSHAVRLRRVGAVAGVIRRKAEAEARETNRDGFEELHPEMSQSKK